MKVCVYGAGAVGGHIAARLAEGGADVAVVARGAQLAAIRDSGLRVVTPERSMVSRPTASDDPAMLGRQDIVVVAVKAPALADVARGIAPLLGPDTPVVLVMNGIPWWYFHAHGGPLDDRRIDRVDPGGTAWRLIGPERVVGAVAHTACVVVEPGVVSVANPRNSIVLGRPDGRDDPRVDAMADCLRDGGIDVTVTTRIRDAIWQKVLMNLVGGALGIVTASAMGEALAEPAVLAAAERMTDEAVAVAKALGCDPGDPRPGLTRLRSSRHRQSILQDLTLGRSMEVDALLAAPLDLARLAGIATPTADLIVGLATRRAIAAGLYQPSSL